MKPNFYWINEPRQWAQDGEEIQVITDENTDFWCNTWYGFNRFSGHVYGCEVEQDFTFQVRIKADFKTLYDQAGLMILSDEQHWLKAGIEFSDDQPMIGSVLTAINSDWATGYYPGNPQDFWLRITLVEGCLRVQYSTDGQRWPLLRLAPFKKAERYTIGLMCCTPQRAGLKVVFSDMRLTPALKKDLHDLS